MTMLYCPKCKSEKNTYKMGGEYYCESCGNIIEKGAQKSSGKTEKTQEQNIQLNKDGFYDDILPVLEDEIDETKKEVIVRAIGVCLGLLGTIFFLIYIL